MFNSLDVLDDLVPVSELSNGRTSAVLSKADRAPVIIIKRNKPSYVLMGINDYQDLLDRLEDTEDWARPNRNRCSKASPRSARIRCHPVRADTASRCATRIAPIWPDCAKSSSGTLESEGYTSRFSRKEPWSSSS